MKMVIIICWMLSPIIAVGGTPYTDSSYVITAPRGSNAFLVMVPDDKQGPFAHRNAGIGKCLQVKADGSFKELWTVPWYSRMDSLYLHHNGASLLRVHDIEKDERDPKRGYSGETALSFYVDSNLAKTYKVKDLIQSFIKSTAENAQTNHTYSVIKSVHISYLATEDLEFDNLNNVSQEEFGNDLFFCVTTNENVKFYFRSNGQLVTRK